MKIDLLLGFLFFTSLYSGYCGTIENKYPELDTLYYYKSKVDKYKFEAPLLYKKYIDKIEELTNNNKDSKVLFYAHSILGYIYKLEGNYSKAINNYFLALELKNQAKEQKEITDIYDNLVYIYRNMGELGRMYEFSKKSISIKEKIEDIKGVHKTNLILAYNHKITGNYIEAFEISYDALNYFQGQKDTSGILLTYHSIILIYKSLENYEKAMQIADLCTPYINETRFMKETSTLYNGVGNILVEMGEYHKGLNYLLKSLEMEEIMGDKIRILLRYNNIGVAYSHLKNFEPALNYFNECINVYKAANHYRYLANIYNSIGMCYEEMNMPDSAIHHYSISIELANKFNAKEVYINSALRLSKVFDNIGNYNLAYKYLKEYNELIRSIDKSNASHHITATEFEYLQQKDQIIKEIEKKNRLLFNATNLSLLVLVILISWLVVKKLKAKIRKSQSDRCELENHKAELSKKISSQNKELVCKILQLSDYNSGIESTVQGLKKLKSEVGAVSRQRVQELVNSLEHSVNDNLWNEFEHMFIKVNPLLFENLSKNYPNLTVNERRLCALIHLNLSSKEIANITKQSQNSILVAKNRLKNKFGIKDSSNITDLLYSLTQ